VVDVDGAAGGVGQNVGAEGDHEHHHGLVLEEQLHVAGKVEVIFLFGLLDGLFIADIVFLAAPGADPEGDGGDDGNEGAVDGPAGGSAAEEIHHGDGHNGDD